MMSISIKNKLGFFSRFFLKSRQRSIFLLAIVGFTLIVIFLISGYYSALKTVSYLPENRSFSPSSLSKVNQKEIKTPWYILMVDQNGRVKIRTLKGDTILSDLRYYSEYVGEKGSWGLTNVSVQLTNDSTITILGNVSKNASINLSLVVNKSLPKLDIKINTKYYRNTLITREALVASFTIPVSEVYLKNRKFDKENFEAEYWLNKEGVRFGSDERSALIYHTPLVSSLQLKTDENLLFINLDYYLDHPFAYMPFLKDGDGKLDFGGDLVNQSKSNYTIGSERNNSFSINIGSLPVVTPRLMSVPYGYQSAYIFTEHADGGTIQSQRTVYFGSEDISQVSDATGGFVKHKIPVTKSVFYIDSTGMNGSAIYEKQNESLLLNFLDQLNATGLYDICLHTPENLTSNRMVLEESIKFMKNRYNTVSWIDHGFFGGLLNRECLVADGLDSGSKYYSADLWNKYSTRYFWSSAVEFIDESSHTSITSKIKNLKFYNAYVSLWKYYLSPRELKEMNPNQALKELSRRYKDQNELNSFKPHRGDSYPSPLYWQNPTRTDQFYSWTTDYSQTFNDLSPEIVERENIQIDNLVKDWGIFISHGYYVRKEASTVIIEDRNGKLIINPYFDEILRLIAQKRDKGELFSTTVRDLLDYWINLENISFDYLPSGEVNIINKNITPINGLSIVLNTNKVKINGKVPLMKRVGADTIIWFDIKANETMQLKIIK